MACDQNDTRSNDNWSNYSRSNDTQSIGNWSNCTWLNNTWSNDTLINENGSTDSWYFTECMNCQMTFDQMILCQIVLGCH